MKKDRSGLARKSVGLSVWVIFPVLAVMLVHAGCTGKLDNDTAALVNGRPIRMSDLKLAARMGREAGDVGEDAPAVRKRILEQLIAEELIIHEAGELGLGVSEQELSEQIRLIKADFPDQAFEEMLIRECVDYDAWKEALKRSLLIRKTTDAAIRNRTRNDPEDWRAYYRQHLARMDENKRIRVMHITLPSKDGIEAVRRKLSAGQSFERVASESGLPADSDGLKPVWIQPGFLPAPMARAILETQVGQVSSVVESEYGYSIFKILEIEIPEGATPLTLMAEIQKRYFDQQASQAYAEWMGDLRIRAKIVVHPSLKETPARSE